MGGVWHLWERIAVPNAGFRRLLSVHLRLIGDRELMGKVIEAAMRMAIEVRVTIFNQAN